MEKCGGDFLDGSGERSGTNIDFIVSTGVLPEVEMINGFPLPEGRLFVTLRVDVDGTTVYEQLVNCTLQDSVGVTLRGSGTKDVSYYWDGVLQETFTLQFT